MHSNDVKYKAIVHYNHFCRSLRTVAKLYRIGKSTLQRWVNARRTTCARLKRSASTTRQDVLNAVRTALTSNPFSTTATIVQYLKATLRFTISSSTASRVIKAAGFTKKKAFRVSSTRPDTSRVLRFCSDYCDHRDHRDDIICVDESCFYLGDHPRMGYAPKGTRLHVAASPMLRRKKFTLIMAVGRDGVVHYDVSECNCNKSRFIAFVNSIPRPPGTVLLMDNVAFHRSKETQAALNAKGFRPLFIPPYSPALNAIENVFSVVKRAYKSHCPCSFDASFDYVSLLMGAIESVGTCSNYFDRVESLVLSTLADNAVSFCGVDG